jgi:hypothetical protein
MSGTRKFDRYGDVRSHWIGIVKSVDYRRREGVIEYFSEIGNPYDTALEMHLYAKYFMENPFRGFGWIAT